MKKLIFALLAMAVLCSCGGRGEHYTITFIPGDSLSSVRLVNADMELSEIAVLDYNDNTGEFTAKGRVEEPVQAILVNEYDDPLLSLFLESGDIRITFDENDFDYYATGTPSNDGFSTARRAIVERSAELQRQFEAGEIDGETLDDEMYSFFNGLVDDNNDNLFGVSLFASLGVQNMYPAEILERIEKFPAKFRKGKVLQEIKEYAQTALKSAEGAEYMDIAAPNTEGQVVALSSLVGEGKWVLVDFWATWCGPCRGELPYLKAAYEKYADRGFEIYGVSLDNDREGWKAFVEENGMTWVNVIDVREDKSSPAAEAYGISAIPSNFLISPDGRIAAKNLRGTAVEERLSEIFAE